MPPTNDPGQDAFSARDWPGWFLYRDNANPRDDEAVLPIETQRAIRIEGFYLVVRAANLVRSQTETTMLESATFEIQLVNDFLPCRDPKK